MAPRTIAIRKNANGIDPISPIPVRANDFPKTNIPTVNTKGRSPAARIIHKSADRQGIELDELKNKYEETKAQMEEMKRQKNENSKRLIEMSGLVSSLNAIPVSYNKSKEGNNFTNVQRKIDAIMGEMDEAKNRYDELRDEKFFQNDTIRSQELQIKSMEQQIVLLNERLQREEREQKEEQVKKEEAKTKELEQQVMLQEMEIMNLTAEIDQLQKGSAHRVAAEIKIHEASNAAKYAEIQKMEEKLASMRVEQEAQKSRQADILNKNTEDKAEFVIAPTETIVAEIDKLKDDLGNLRLVQEKKRALESSETLKILPSSQNPNPANEKTKSQPWNRDLAWQDSLNHKKTELELVTNKDVVTEESVCSEASKEEQTPLTLPNLGTQKRLVKSARKKKKSKFGATDRSVSSSSENSQSLESIAEEIENEPEEIKPSKSVGSDNSDTSATVTGESSTTELSESGMEKSKNMVEVMPSDDGSVEVRSYTKSELKASLSQSSDDNTVDSSEAFSTTSSCNDSYSNEESSRDESSNENSSGIYSSESSAQSSSRSILEQIPEGVEGETDSSEVDAETDNSDSEWDGVESIADEEEKDLQVDSLEDQKAGSLLLRQQLKESESKYDKIKMDYNNLVAKSQLRLDKLEGENRKLRESQAQALNNMAKESEDESKERWIKQENKMLLKSMEKQNQVMAKQNKDYEKLQREHSVVLSKFEDKKRRYDQLILDFSNLAGNGKTSQDYNRLKALHDSVVLKLADISEENEKLEKERDEVIDQLENKDVQIRAYHESKAALKKTEYDLKNLEELHEETIKELQQVRDKNKELADFYDKESSNAAYSEKLKEDYVKAMTEMDLLVASNNEFKGIDEKLNASEVKVTMLEEQIKLSQEKLLASKKKSNARAGQLREVIEQYKTLKNEYTEKCEKLTRLEVVVGDSNDKAVEEMKKMESDLDEAKKEATEAVAGKEAREKDLKIVLQHYEKLQQKYEKLRLEKNSTNGHNQVEKKEDPESIDDKKQRDDIENLEKSLKESKESITWKDQKIANTLMELREAKEELETLENEKKELEVELSEVKSNLLLARRETENAEGRKSNGQEQLRTAIAKHHQLQQVYDSLLKKFGDTSAELQKAKNEIKVKEQEEKHARKRASTVHSQYKKLQVDHGVVVQRLEKLKQEMTTEQTEY